VTTPSPIAGRTGPRAIGAGAGRPALRRLRLDRKVTFWGLVVPPSVWLTLFFLVPLVLIAVISLRPDLRGGVLVSFPPTLDQYRTLLEKPAYLRLFGTSIVMALGVAAAATVVAFPIAYFLAFRAGRRAGLFLALLLIPFWTSFLLRVMAWKVMLGSGGVINSFLLSTGLTTEPVAFLLYNRFAVVITLIYVWTPFVALPILAGLQRIDPTLFEAAADLGSTPARRFWRIVLPLSAPGVIAGFFMCFIPTVGEYVTPLLVGGSGGLMYGNLIQDFFTKAANWPLGSAMSLVMLVGTLVFVALALRLINLRHLVG
jgi:spermidine/putrescine transport system permease protein